MLDFILTQGRLSPPHRGHPRDAKDPAYYHGRFRPCYYCGIVTEKEYRVKGDGSPAEEMCNAMQCQNPQCLKKWHWNYGDHRKHPNCRGADAVHDFKLDEQRYEPREAPRL